jgi:hypothetical protein
MTPHDGFQVIDQDEKDVRFLPGLKHGAKKAHKKNPTVNQTPIHRGRVDLVRAD